ncbi:MAG TPA: hypothetical protein VFE72_06065, partial [Lysobacter sp.]|nr:hypothetical protein [Lysobacter sp.]
MTHDTSRGALREVLALLEKATAFDVETAEHRDIGLHDCPLCDGEGAVEGTTYTNFDRVATGVQFFGVGNEHVHLERAVLAAYRFLREHGAALAAPAQGAVPDGWALVPREPTEAMHEAGKLAHHEAETRACDEASLGTRGMYLRANRAAHVYAAMLAAAPQATHPPAPSEDVAALGRIGELIRTQDNRITADPIFVVEQKRSYVTDPDYNDARTIWIDDEGVE